MKWQKKVQKLQKDLSRVSPLSISVVVVLFVVLLFGGLYINRQQIRSSERFSVQTVISLPPTSAVTNIPSPVPTAKSDAWTKKIVIHTADPSSTALLSYTYQYKNNYQGWRSGGIKGFSIAYPANWDFVITAKGWGKDLANSRDEIDVYNKENILVIDQPIEGAGCFYPPKPTGGYYGWYFTDFKDIRTIEGKIWRRSKVDTGFEGGKSDNSKTTYFICQSDGNDFSDDNILGAISYEIQNDDQSIVSQMDTMVQSITLVK